MHLRWHHDISGFELILPYINPKKYNLRKNGVCSDQKDHSYFRLFYFIFFMHFCPGTITTHAESINSDLQRGLDRRLRHIQH